MDIKLELAQFTDYLREYNKLTEKCFSRCINSMNSRLLAEDEMLCVSSCVSKHLHTTQKIMLTYQQLQPMILEKRQAEAEEKIRELVEKQKLVNEEQQILSSENEKSKENRSTNAANNSIHESVTNSLLQLPKQNTH